MDNVKKNIICFVKISADDFSTIIIPLLAGDFLLEKLRRLCEDRAFVTAIMFVFFYIIAGTGFLPLLSGCGQMLYAIKKKMSQIAQLSFVKLQSNIIISLLALFGVWKLLNPYSCFQMEVAARTRSLTKSKRVLALLKIVAVLSIVRCLLIVSFLLLIPESWVERALDISYLGFTVLATVICLIEAFKVQKILAERDQLIKVSSYSEDAYLEDKLRKYSSEKICNQTISYQIQFLSCKKFM